MAVSLLGVMQTNAMTEGEIRENARFLSDRMAYELGLTPEQYADCYEINYDFLCSIDPYMNDVCYGYNSAIDNYYSYLDYRNEDLRYIMNELQYRTFMGLDYFFRPIYTYSGGWMFRIFDRYSNRGFFYYEAPGCYFSYHGGHGRHFFHDGFYHNRYSFAHYREHHFFHGRGFEGDFGPRSGRDHGGYYGRNGYRHGGDSGRGDYGRGGNFSGSGRRGNSEGFSERGGSRNGSSNRGGSSYRGSDNRNGGMSRGSESSHSSMGRGSESSHSSNFGSMNQGNARGGSSRGGESRGSMGQGGGNPGGGSHGGGQGQGGGPRGGRR